MEGEGNQELVASPITITPSQVFKEAIQYVGDNSKWNHLIKRKCFACGDPIFRTYKARIKNKFGKRISRLINDREETYEEAIERYQRQGNSCDHCSQNLEKVKEHNNAVRKARDKKKQYDLETIQSRKPTGKR